MIKLQNEKITLREAKNFDSKKLEELANEKLVKENFFIEETLDNYFDSLNEWNKPTKLRDYYGFVIEENRKIKGFLSLIKKEKMFLNYFIGKDYREKGLAKEAIQLVTPFVFNELNEPKLYAKVLKSNSESSKLLKKLNFELYTKKQNEKYNIYFLKKSYENYLK